MAIIHQHDKRSGITYAYESKAYWDKEKKMSRAKRTLIGRVDPETGETVATDGRNRKAKIVNKQDPDYMALYEKAQKQIQAQNLLIESLNRKIAQLEAAEK